MQEFIQFCTNYLTKFSVDLDGNWHFVEICLISIQGRRPFLCDLQRRLKCWLVLGNLQTDFFESWYGDRDHQTQFDPRLVDLGLFLKSALCETLVPIFCVQNSQLILMKFSMMTACFA